jgi:hypothetical protein
LLLEKFVIAFLHINLQLLNPHLLRIDLSLLILGLILVRIQFLIIFHGSLSESLDVFILILVFAQDEGAKLCQIVYHLLDLL